MTGTARKKFSVTTREDAEKVFREKTGLDPAVDPSIRFACWVAGIAELFKHVHVLGRWTRAASKATDSPPEGFPEWASRSLKNTSMQLGAAALHDKDREVAVGGLAEEAAAIAADFAELQARAESALDRLHSLARDAEGLRKETQAVYSNDGSWTDEAPAHHPIDWTSRRFINGLNNHRKKLGQRGLTATEVALLAIATGMEKPPGDNFALLRDKWAKRIREAKRAT